MLHVLEAKRKFLGPLSIQATFGETSQGRGHFYEIFMLARSISTLSLRSFCYLLDQHSRMCRKRWVSQEKHKAQVGGYMDVVYVGVGLLFFALCWGFLRLCERL